jgi:hypothetical protein
MRMLERTPSLEAGYFSNDDMAIGGYRSTIKHHEPLLVERYRSVCRTLERIDAMRPRPRKSSGIVSPGVA